MIHVIRVSSERRPITKKMYLAGLMAIFASAYSQYLFRGIGPMVGMLLVYGIPLLITGYIWGSAIVKKALTHTYSALKVGIGLFGAFTVLGTLTGALVFYVLSTLDPTAVNLLHKPNPVLQISPEFAWIMVAVSFLIIGPAEEYLFRGFIYGGLLDLFKGRHWIGLGFVSSVLFAVAHLYYAFVYGVASLVQFVDLMTFGMAMAATYYLSGGNLFAVALIHGAYDATGFIGVATSLGVGTLLRGLMILVGMAVAIGLFTQKIRKKKAEHL